MKGQLLFVRSAGEADRAPIAELLELADSAPLPSADRWFVAKLVGRFVACAAFATTAEEADLRLLRVETELRGKRIGLQTLDQIEQQFRAEGIRRLAIRKDLVPERFALRAGYAPAADSFVKQLEASPA